jgi:hypothetical protein
MIDTVGANLSIRVPASIVAACLCAAVAQAQFASERRLDASVPVPYFIADGTGHPGYRSGDRQLARWAVESWQRSARGGLRLVAGPESDALVRVYWADPQEGQYGEMRPLVVDGREGAAVYIRPDMTALGPDIARLATRDPLLRDSIVYLTCLHELGHALGLAHTDMFDDIMYSFQFGGDVTAYFERYRRQIKSRRDIVRASGLSMADRDTLRRLYTVAHH